MDSGGDLVDAVISSVWDMVLTWRDVHCAKVARKAQIEVQWSMGITRCMAAEAV